MRVFASLLAISFLVGTAAEARPRRVASLNLCTDELVLAIAAPDQIAAVTHLSQDPAEAIQWRAARRYRRNDGSLLSVVPLRPDLVVTMGGGGSDRLRIASRLGIRMLNLPFPTSIADVERSIARLAVALGRAEAGAALLRRIERLKARRPSITRDSIWLGGGGQTVPARGLAADWMALAGLRQRAVRGDRISLETLITNPPAILLRSAYREGQFSRAQRWLSHPRAVRAGGARQIRTDGRPWTCMGPTLIPEMERLRGMPGT
jgi:iron complex transport system substrate-binding protein